MRGLRGTGAGKISLGGIYCGLLWGLMAGVPGEVVGQEGGGAAGRSILSRSKAEPPRFPDSSSELGLPSFVPVDDADLGTLMILQERPDYDPFTVSIASGLYYTDNAGLDEQDEIEDGYWWTSTGLTYLPQIAGGLAAEFGVNYETFRYESSGFLDFDELEAGAGLVYVFRDWGDLSVFGRYNYDRIMEPRDYTEVYVQHGLVAGFYKPYVINRQHFMYLRGLAEFGLDANPESAKQDDYQLMAGYRFSATDDLWLEPYYRIRYLDFSCGCRGDLGHTFGLGVNYRLSENFLAGIAYYYTMNDSNKAFGDYEAGSLGANVGFQIQF